MASHLRHSIQHSLLSRNFLFTFLVLLIGTSSIVVLSITLLTQYYIAQMAAGAVYTSGELVSFQADLEDVLNQFQNDEAMIGQEKAVTARALSRLYRASKNFQQVLLANDETAVIYAYPPQELGTTLSTEEESAISLVFESGEIQRAVSKIDEYGLTVSYIIPVIHDDLQIETLLIGRVPAIDLINILDVKGEEPISSFLINSENQVLLQTGGAPPLDTWSDEAFDTVRILNVPMGVGGKAYLRQISTKGWDLVFVGPKFSQSWNVAMVLPFQRVLNQGLFFGFSFAAVISLLGAVYLTNLRSYGQGISKPIKQLAKESHLIAEGGSLTNRIYTNRQDEIGELTHAFTDMQLALKGRLDELSLLLDVTQDISSSINIKQSMPIILQGALRGTGASGARVLILDPTGRTPLVFKEGPSGPDLKIFDRSLMGLLREHKELALGNVQQISERTGLDQFDIPPIRALYALPLQTNNVFQGVIFLGFRQTRAFSLSERQLLRTLAGQATVLVDNAYLFANAEGGRKRLAAVLASTSEAIIVTDQTDRILAINRAMENAFRITSKQVKGRNLGEVIGSKQFVEALNKSKTGKLDFEIKGKNDRSYFVNISPIVNQSGLFMGRVAILTDVTHYKEIERLKSEFVNSVSHDLRTPLTVMHGYMAALSMADNLTSEQLEFIEKMSHNVEHMTTMVETLLDLGRIEAGVGLLFEEVDVSALLRELIDEQWHYAHEAGLKLKVEGSRNLPPLIADKSLINQAISNFLTNTYKYAPKSGEIILAAQQIGNEIVIKVQDNGPGIARQDQLRLFEKFYRVPGESTEEIDGTGLGLGLVKSIADRHHGRAWVESEIGRGSTFYLSIPLQGIEATNPEA